MIPHRFARLLGAVLLLAPSLAFSQSALQQPCTDRTKGCTVEALPSAVSKLYGNDLYLQSLIGTRFGQLGPVAFLGFGTAPGTVADGGALTAETARATAAEQSNATGIANLSTALNAKASLASPAFTGTPTAPTPTAGDSTTKLATTQFVANAVSAGGGGSAANEVLYTAQTLTGPQQAQARSNIAGAASGANSDITSLSGLTTPLSIAQGGTGATAASGARTLLGAAASGANTDITSLASPALAAATATTQAAADSSTKVSTTAYADRAATNAAAAIVVPASVPAKNGRLTYTSATVVTFSQGDGALLYVGGANRAIPAAGVPLSNSGLAASTAYFVYAYWTGSALASEASTTGPVVDSATGLKFKSGDSTRTLVGWLYTNASSQFQAQPGLVLSYFERRDIVASATLASQSGSSSPAVELNTAFRVYSGCWDDESFDVDVRGNAQGNTGVTGLYMRLSAFADSGSTLGNDAQTGGFGNTSFIGNLASRVGVKPGVNGLRYGGAYGGITGSSGGFSATFTNLVIIVKTRG